MKMLFTLGGAIAGALFALAYVFVVLLSRD